MNARTKIYLDGIKIAEHDFLDKANNILLRYRAEKEKIISISKRYKDEDSYINENLPKAKQSARDALTKAETTFRETLRKNIIGMKTELKATISTPVPKEFSEQLSFYRTAGLTPSRTETEALLELGKRSPLSVKAVAKLLEDTHADIKIQCRSIEDYEKDLADLDDLAEMPLISSPFSTHTELVDVLRGTPKLTRTAVGWRNTGETWADSVAVLLQTSAVSTRLKALENVADSWSADVTDILREREYDSLVNTEKEAAEKAGKEYVPEKQPTSSTTITERENAEIALAKQLGKEIADADKAIRNSPYVR